MKTNTVVFSLGSNYGNRLYNIRTAERMLPLQHKQYSHIYESKALLKNGSPEWWNLPFFNAIIFGYTTLSPKAMLQTIHLIEGYLGRKNIRKSWSPRTIDIDIIFWKDKKIASTELTIPHQEMHNRNFVLIPLCQILSTVQHPSLHLSVNVLLKNLKKQNNYSNNCKNISNLSKVFTNKS